jgi:putative endonuclease
VCYVYILRNQKSGRFYIGIAEDPEKRLARHNAGKVTATRTWRPLEIAFKQQYGSKLQAQRIERHLKSLKRRDALEKIIRSGHIEVSP